MDEVGLGSGGMYYIYIYIVKKQSLILEKEEKDIGVVHRHHHATGALLLHIQYAMNPSPKPAIPHIQDISFSLSLSLS